MADARIQTSLPTHPKTKKLIRRLGPAGAWHLVRLFLWAAENRTDGNLTGLSDEDLELAVDFDGEEGAFVQTLVSVGFLDGEEGARSIHDWAEHNPWAAGAEARSEKSKWAALCKRHGREVAAMEMPEYAARLQKQSQEKALGVPESASGTPVAESGSAPLPSPSPLPSPLPNHSSLRSEVGSADAPQPAKQKRKTAGQIEKPEGVTEQTWDDWMALRKRKGAPVTTTVLNSAIREAEKARISLEDFLQIWCFRGSQGLQADWIKPHELAGRAVMGGMQVARPLNKQEALEARNRAIGEEWARDMMRREGVLGD